MSEFTANHALESAAIERARWAAVLATPASRAPRATRKPAGLLAVIRALFA